MSADDHKALFVSVLHVSDKFACQTCWTKAAMLSLIFSVRLAQLFLFPMVSNAIQKRVVISARCNTS